MVCAILSGMVYIKEPLLLIRKSSSCCGSRFLLSLSEWSFTVCLTPYNHKQNVLSASLNKAFPSIAGPFLNTITTNVLDWTRTFDNIAKFCIHLPPTLIIHMKAQISILSPPPVTSQSSTDKTCHVLPMYFLIFFISQKSILEFY